MTTDSATTTLSVMAALDAVDADDDTPEATLDAAEADDNTSEATPDAVDADDTPVAALDAADADDEAPEAALEAGEAAADPAAAKEPVPPKKKPITWETERNAAAVALAQAGATPREVRVLASLGAIAAVELRAEAAHGRGDVATVDDRAAEAVLAAHRAAASPDWKQ